MMSSTTERPNQSAFVRDVLERAPASNAAAVNAEWRSAGFEGSISPSLVSKLRSRLGLSGNISPRGADGGRAGKTTRRPGRSPSASRSKKGGRGKTSFIKEVLYDNPRANATDVNEAWANAGMKGTISKSLVSRLRAELGLTGNLRERPVDPEVDYPVTTRTAVAASPVLRKPGRPSDRDRALAEIEADLDRTIFRLMAVGGFEKVEDELRRVRRLLVRSHSG